MNTRPIGFALVGCGKIARKHADALEELPGARLAAVCDTVAERAEEFATRYAAHAYSDVEELLADREVEVVVVATPSGMHAPLAIQAARAGKHLLVEKPLALTLDQCRAVVRASRQAGIKLAVVHPNRFLPNVLALRRALRGGAFGTLTHGAITVRWFRPQEYYDSADWRGTLSMDGGVLFNQALHNIDLLQWMFGPVESVQGAVATQLRQIEAGDLAVAVVRFQSGVLSTVETSVTVYPENLEETLAVFGETGSAIIGGRTISEGVRAWRFPLHGPAVPETPQVRPHWGHSRVIADLVEAIRTEREPAVNGEEAARAIAIILAIYESARTGHAVAPARLEECRA